MGMKLRLPRKTVIKRVCGGLSRINSAPAGLRPDIIKFVASPKLLHKIRDRAPVLVQDECIIN